jgi:hypothetical protein
MEVRCIAKYHKGRSEWLDNVIEAFFELGKQVAHRKELIEKVTEIRLHKGLHLGKTEEWVQYCLGHYSRGKSWEDFFEPRTLGSGYWEYLFPLTHVARASDPMDMEGTH